MPQLEPVDGENTGTPLSDDEESLPSLDQASVSVSAMPMLNYLAGGGIGDAPVIQSVNRDDVVRPTKKSKITVGIRKKKAGKQVADKDEQLSKDVAELAEANQGIVEKITAQRKSSGRLQYKVQWLGYDVKDDSWEPLNHIDSAHSQKILKRYLAEQK
ncbi:M-phase phosphoprotein 8-like [Lineus longissimus]|uniref:M-phase phosphoprotein 8-like n=1 Tax=Lineus longissimus TaxID=88925 RepID=UPI002B4DCBC2